MSRRDAWPRTGWWPTPARSPSAEATAPEPAPERRRPTPERQPTLSGRGVRARLARIGTSQQTGNPVLDPLFRTVRANHPKADLALIERAYNTAERYHRGQVRKSGDPYITHPLAVTTILADIGMTEPTLVAALLHDTVEDTAYTLGRAAHGLRRRGRAAGRRRHQARQGQVRRHRRGRDHPQDDRRDEQGHPGPGHQARRPAAQHAHAALRQAADPGAQEPRDAGDLRAAGPPARHEHAEVGARGPRVRHHAPADLRRDRAAGRRAGALARPVPRRGDQPGRQGPEGRQDQRARHRPAQALLLDLPEDDPRRAASSPTSTTWSASGSWSTATPTATASWACCTTAGTRCPGGSRTTSRCRSSTCTSRCTPR